MPRPLCGSLTLVGLEPTISRLKVERLTNLAIESASPSLPRVRNGSKFVILVKSTKIKNTCPNAIEKSIKVCVQKSDKPK